MNKKGVGMEQNPHFWNKARALKFLLVLIGAMSAYKFGLPAYNTYSAKRDLEKIGITFSEQKFVESACSGDQGSVQLFIQAGMNVNLLAAPGKQDSVPKSVLHCAAIKGNVTMANALIKQGADVNLADEDGNTPLYYSAKNTNSGRDNGNAGLDVANLLISNHVDLNKAGAAGSPLIAAISSNNFELADMLIEKGANAKGTTKDGSTALITLVMQFRGASDVVERAKLLVKAGVDINAENKNGVSALAAACRNNSNGALIETLLGLGADPNIVSNGQSAIALSLSNPETFKLLVKHGASLNSKFNGQTLLHQSISYGSNSPTLNLLLSTGKVDINTKNDAGETALYMAVTRNNNNAIQQLLVHGANPNLTNNSLDTPLIRAVNNNSVEIVRALIEYNADVNLKDASSHTPLFYAKRRADSNLNNDTSTSRYSNTVILNNGRVIIESGPTSASAAEPAPIPVTIPGYGYRSYRAPMPDSYRSPVQPSSMKSRVTQHDPIVDMLIKAGGHI